MFIGEYFNLKHINLTQGKVAIVDDEDFEELNKYKWCYLNAGYACRESSGKMILMHRDINKTPNNKITDHINGNGLDNRKVNLRTCTTSENAMNSKTNLINTSGYRGVSKDNVRGTYRATIKKLDKAIFLGRFKTANEAALAYNKAAIELFGEFARLNEIKNPV